MGWTMWRISWCDARRALLLVLLVPILFLVGCNILTQPDPGPPRTVPPGTPPDPNPGPNPNPNPNPNPDPNPTPDPSPGPGAAARAPYVQMLGRTSAIIVFRTAGAAPGRVEYGTSTAYGAAVDDGTVLQHEVALEGLAPGTRYYYRVSSAGSILAAGETYFFDTDAGRGDPEFAFFVTGDIGDPTGQQARTAQRILATVPRAEMGLLCGDIIYPNGQSSGYDDNLMRPWAGLMRNCAIWPALGNHDWHVNPDDNFRAEWVLPNNEHYFSFDRGPVHFIALDTRDGDIYDPANQVAWLRADLAAQRDARFTVVYYHHPGMTCTYKGYNQAVISRFMPLFDEFGVDLVFTGHAHTFERLYPIRNGAVVARAQDPNYTNPGGTLYVTTGCGSKTTGTTADCDINAAQVDHTVMFTHVTVRGNTLQVRTIDSAAGTVRDEFSLTKTGVVQ